ncbi:hypothetical protein HDU98_010641 [Podochytrium sp. JEL0797]|nr:hypothetical protein HDU98_010641 [Podochytrium sp. JEL0797]
MADQWWTTVSPSVLNPSSVIALFAGDSAVSTLRQSCFRKRTSWLDIGIHPGQMSLASHVLQCIPTPWSGAAFESKALLLGIHTHTIDAKEIVSQVPRHVSCYMASVLQDKLMAAAHDKSTKLIKRSEEGGTETCVAYLHLGEYAHDSDGPILALHDALLPMFQVVSSLLNLTCLAIAACGVGADALQPDFSGILISAMHIASRLLISLCISFVSYHGPKRVQTKDVPRAVVSMDVKDRASTEVFVSASYGCMNKFLLGEDVVSVFGDGGGRQDGSRVVEEEVVDVVHDKRAMDSVRHLGSLGDQVQNLDKIKACSRFEALWTRLYLTDAVFALAVVTTSLASISFLLLFQYTSSPYQISSLLSMLFGWFADNRLKMKSEDSHISIGQIPPGSKLVKIRAQSRALAIAVLYLKEELLGAREGFLNCLPNDAVWSEWKAVLRSVAVARAEGTRVAVPVGLKFGSDIEGALKHCEQMQWEKSNGFVVQEAIGDEF